MTSRNSPQPSDNVVPMDATGPILLTLGETHTARIKAGLYDDYLPQLRGAKALQTFEEMGNDATVASVLFAIEMLVRNVTWTPEALDDTPASVAGLELLTGEFEAMAATWADFMSQVVSALQYGFSFFEVVYRRRADGRIGWDGFEFRPQRTLLEWEWEGDRPVAFTQQLSDGATVTIPLGKALHFRSTTASTAPEGVSLLRRLYRTWYMKKRAEDLLMVGLDKDLVGFPIAYIPKEILEAGPGNAMYDATKKVVTRTKQHAQAGIMWPSDVDPDHGNELFRFDLLQSGGRPRVEPIPVVRMWASDLLSGVLAQFIALGRDSVGSRALATPQQSLFESALGGWLSAFAAVINRQGVHRLMALNGLEDANVRLVPTPIEETDLAGLAAAAKDFAAAVAVFDTGHPDDTIANEMRRYLGFTDAPEDAEPLMQPTPETDQDQE